MSNDELNQLFKAARIPERPANYWEDFPGTVTRELRATRGDKAPSALAPTHMIPRPEIALALGLAIVCLAIGFSVGRWRGRQTGTAETTLAEAQKYYREIAQLFPNQVRAIVFDQKGTHLILAERADVSESAPIFMKICGPKGCQGVVTFSGQQISIGSQPVDVLVGPRGEIILAGPDSLWSSRETPHQLGEYRIQAESLGGRL